MINKYKYQHIYMAIYMTIIT